MRLGGNADTTANVGDGGFNGTTPTNTLFSYGDNRINDNCSDVSSSMIPGSLRRDGDHGRADVRAVVVDAIVAVAEQRVRRGGPVEDPIADVRRDHVAAQPHFRLVERADADAAVTADDRVVDRRRDRGADAIADRRHRRCGWRGRW